MDKKKTNKMIIHTLVIGVAILIFTKPILAKPIKVRERDSVIAVTVAKSESDASGETLVCLSKPRSDYSRVLMRFDLSRIDPTEHGRVKQAVLRLHTTEATNAARVPTEVSGVTVPWSDRATWVTADGDTPWPSQRRRQHIDFAKDGNHLTSQVVEAPGPVEWDVTRIVDAWLYQDVPNCGFMISMGPSIGGAPTGDWNIVFAGTEATSAEQSPTLVVEMTGLPPTPETISDRTLRWFPSSQLAPVRDPYIFYWGFGEAPNFPGAVANVAQVSRGNLEPAQRGLLPINWHAVFGFGVSCEQDVIDYYVGRAHSGMLGIMVDEWQRPRTSYAGRDIAPGEAMHPDNPWGITGAIKGMIQVKKANPSFYIAVAWRGEESIEPATQVGLPDLLLIESYTHLARKHKKSMGIGMPGIKKRIDAARKLGAIDRTICWLGHIRKAGVGPENYHEGHVLTADMVEQQVAELRRYAPEMPGIAFYRNDDPELSGACDRVCRKYFVDAAPNVRLTRPHFQQVITSAHVEVVAEAQTKDDRQIREYRWFVDNRLVQKSVEPVFLWDLRDLANGLHFLTVHAIDTGWNRAAAQVPVTVAR